jgi:hypothetical protein
MYNLFLLLLSLLWINVIDALFLLWLLINLDTAVMVFKSQILVFPPRVPVTTGWLSTMFLFQPSFRILVDGAQGPKVRSGDPKVCRMTSNRRAGE